MMKIRGVFMLMCWLAMLSGSMFAQRDQLPKVEVLEQGSFFFNFKQTAMKKSSKGELQIVSHFNEMLNLSEDFSFVKESEHTNTDGEKRQSFQQLYKGIKIEGGTVLLRSRNGESLSMNGKIMQDPNFSFAIESRIGIQEAYEKAVQSLQVEVLWRYVEPQQVIFYLDTKPQLTYKVRVEGMTASGKIIMHNVFVSAQTGEILRKVPLIAHVDRPARVETRYSGMQDVTVDCFEEGRYRLRDSARKIETYHVGGLFPDISESGNEIFPDPIDITHDSTFWPAQKSVVSAHLNTGTTLFLNVNPFAPVDFFSAAFHYESSVGGDTTQIVESYLTTTDLPLTVQEMYFPVENKTCVGSFQKYKIDPNPFSLSIQKDTGSQITYSITEKTPGVHTWSDGKGNAGIYTIASAKNPVLDAHWGITKTYDFYKHYFNRESYDGNGSVIKNFYDGVCVLAQTQNNALALPEPYSAMVYGTGDGEMFSPFTSLDITAHEYTHLVTGKTSDLEYNGESGALNESFSDMMGMAVEYYAKGSASWTIGDQIFKDGSYFRSLSDPKSTGNFNGGYNSIQPDTYKGRYWINTNSEEDNGGVHINSGVGNKWFYLIVEGGSGTNDKGYSYNVQPIGMEKAQKIAFETFTTRLTRYAQYIDAREASLSFAEEHYGEGSPEYNSVREAWMAVGVVRAGAHIKSPEWIAHNIHFYPNPARETMIIESNLEGQVTAEMLDVTGRKLKTFSVEQGTNTINISSFYKGVFFLRYTVGGQSLTQKFIVQ